MTPDVELSHMLNKLLEEFPIKTQLRILNEMIHMESDEHKLKHLKAFFALKLMESRKELLIPLDERAKLPVGKMNRDLQ